MSNGVAPIVFISYSHDSPEHKDQVRAFSAFLRTRFGLDVRLDQWDDNRRRDWSLWATGLFKTADYIVVIASPEYRKRAEGEAAADEGRGAQFEAAMIRDALTRDLGAATERILPVVLPGGSIDNIPTFLNPHSTTHFTIPDFTPDGIEGLLAAITGIGKHPLPELGDWLGTGQPEPTHPTDPSRWLAHSRGFRPDAAHVDGIRYPDSIVLRSAARTGPAFVEIDLGGAYQRFMAVAGVLDDARDLHQVVQFRVSVDGKVRLRCNAALGKPREIDVPVLGATKLRLEVHRLRGPFDVAWGDPSLT
jgi:hypothetical protein